MKERKTIRLNGYDYSGDGSYFITICSERRKCLFGKISDGNMYLNNLGKIIHNELLGLNNDSNLSLDTYIIMPNHVHFILHINGISLSQSIQKFKSRTHKQCSKLTSVATWQRGYYEHIIRSERALQNLREYILNNPIKWEVDGDNPKFLD